MDDKLDTPKEDNSDEKKGSENENISLIERAEKLNKETFEAEKRIAEHRKRIEEIETKRILGGQTTAGSISKTPEELKSEASDEMASDIVNAFKRK